VTFFLLISNFKFSFFLKNWSFLPSCYLTSLLRCSIYVAGKIIKKCLAKRQALNNFASKTYNIDIETSLKKIENQRKPSKSMQTNANSSKSNEE